MLVPSHHLAAASLRILPTQPWLKGSGINWMTTRRGLPFESGARSMTIRSVGAMATHSPALAEATISDGAGWVLTSCAETGNAAYIAALANRDRYLFIDRVMANHCALRKRKGAARGVRPQGECGDVAEWSKAHAWKVCIGVTLSWVRIPPSPPTHRVAKQTVSSNLDH